VGRPGFKKRTERTIGLSAIDDLQHEIEERLRGGQPLAEIECDVIDPSDLSEDDKSALWLYGWASWDHAPLRHPQPERTILR
jgi:hypothetical protein